MLSFFPALYRRLAQYPFNIPPPVVAQMELWQVVAVLGLMDEPDDVDEPAVPVVAGGRTLSHQPRISDGALIRARLAAASRGEPEPIHLLGAPRTVDLPE